MSTPLQDDICKALRDGPLTIQQTAAAVGSTPNPTQEALAKLTQIGRVRRRGRTTPPYPKTLFELVHTNTFEPTGGCMSVNAPIGVITDSAAKLASEISRRRRGSNCTVLAWAEHGDVFAQDVLTRAARRIEREKPGLIIGLYTKAARVPDIQADVEAMQLEIAA